jgi:hypothetical protein
MSLPSFALAHHVAAIVDEIAVVAGVADHYVGTVGAVESVGVGSADQDIGIGCALDKDLCSGHRAVEAGGAADAGIGIEEVD